MPIKAHWFSKDLLALLLMGAILVACQTAFLLIDVSEDREEALEVMQTSEAERARVLAGQVDSLIVMADRMASDAIDDALFRPRKTLPETTLYGDHLIDGHVIKQILRFDATGRRWATDGRGKDDCSSCLAFRNLRDSGRETLVGAFFDDIPGAKGAFGFARRIVTAAGSFGGMVVVVVDLAAILSDYGWDRVSVVLFTPDLRIVARFTHPGAAPPFPELLAIGTSPGEARAVTLEGLVAAVQRLQYYPLYVGIAESTASIDRVAAQDMRVNALFSGGVAAAVILFCLAVGWHIARRRQAEQLLAQARDSLELRVEERTAELRRTETQFQRFMENAPTGAHITDKTGHFLYANQRFARWLGLTPQEVVGKTAREVLPKELIWLWEEHDHEVLASGRTDSREVIFHHDETERVWLSDKFPLQLDEEPRLVGGLVTDLTQRRAAERELHHVHRMKALGQLAGGVAHDLNNLLTIMRGNLEIVEDLAPEGSAVRNHAREAQWAARRGAHLTDRLLSMSRKHTPVTAVMDVNEVVGSMSELLSRTLGKEIEISLTFSAQPALARIDVNRMENAVLNLCLNARDAMPRGGQLELAVSVALDSSPSAMADERVILTVRDDGGGMPPEIVERACNPFFTTKAVGKGTGLGLSMVKGFVAECGGEMAITSALGAGTVVTLSFPLASPAAEVVDPAAYKPIDQTLPRTILLVEDEPEVAHLAAEALAALGCRVSYAADAQGALEILARNSQFDLLFTDVMMPGGMNGIELARHVQRQWPQIAILLTSGFHGGFSDDDEGPLAFPLLRKPYDRKALVHAIQAVVTAGPKR
ncbi:MAG TPA: PAS domain-containing protein [Rhodospirillaceae bacterium]|nr:PAS domain-containing protein [Rhodospirillaceae bacterium]